MNLCVAYSSQSSERLFPLTALTGRLFIHEKVCVYCAVRTKTLYAIQLHLNLSRPKLWYSCPAQWCQRKAE